VIFSHGETLGQVVDDAVDLLLVRHAGVLPFDQTGGQMGVDELLPQTMQPTRSTTSIDTT
jgi:hypothetical protein